MQYDTYNNALTVLIGDTYVKSILHQNVIYNSESTVFQALK